MTAIESKIRTTAEAPVRRFWPHRSPSSWPTADTNSGSVSFAPVSSCGRSRTLKGHLPSTGDVDRIQVLGQIRGGTLLLGSRSVEIGKTSDRSIYSGSVGSSASSALELLPKRRRGVVSARVSQIVSGESFSGINQVLVALASHLDANQ